MRQIREGEGEGQRQRGGGEAWRESPDKVSLRTSEGDRRGNVDGEGVYEVIRTMIVSNEIISCNFEEGSERDRLAIQ